MSPPAFLIHPLLENAIKHGARDDGGPLRVRLDARVTGDALRVEVWNTGSLVSRVPSDSPRGAELGLVGSTPNVNGTGIGVRNVRERLARLFPGRHRFELTDEQGWVRAMVELPARAAASSAA